MHPKKYDHTGEQGKASDAHVFRVSGEIVILEGHYQQGKKADNGQGQKDLPV